MTASKDWWKDIESDEEHNKMFPVQKQDGTLNVAQMLADGKFKSGASQPTTPSPQPPKGQSPPPVQAAHPPSESSPPQTDDGFALGADMEVAAEVDAAKK